MDPFIRSILFLGSLGLAILSGLLGWSLLLGWALARVVEVSLFEGALLSLIATSFTVYLMLSFLRSSRLSEEFEDDLYETAFEIPETRFYRTSTERTWSAWFRFQVANIVFTELKFSETSTVKTMEKVQMQELAIRLSEIALEVVKQKDPQSRRVSFKVGDFKRQMITMGLKPYEDGILKSAVDALDMAFSLPFVNQIFRDKTWDEQTFID